MKVVVTGATGNVGTSTVRALADEPRVTEIAGLARRAPEWRPPKTTWVEQDILDEGLDELFAGADAVVHLAWAIQPSRDSDHLQRTNVEGSRRVFEAAGRAGVPKLVVASSIGAYSPGPKDRPVDESWPTNGTRSSFYSRHKVAMERLVDRFEQEHPDVAVVRLRPALIFKDEAATEIRRLFLGPFLPGFLLRRQLLPAVPRIADVRVQAVHSDDVGDAYLKAVLKDVRGAFNIAADPPLSGEELAESLGKPSFPVPAPLVRGLASLTWRLHLQPTPPGWLDMARNVPLMSSARAREELGWEPRHSARDALAELLAGIREGHGADTPKLTPDSPAGRVDEIRTGVGSREFARTRDEQLVKYLTDAHAIELQALEQMKRAGKIAGDEDLGRIFDDHLEETRRHEKLVRGRLEQLGREPSSLKDAAGAAGAWPMLAFAASQPDSPGKLVAHAYSYEHMEEAAYELMRRLADRSNDLDTAELARTIGSEEKAMGDRLEHRFDLAASLSLEGVPGERLPDTLNAYLRDAHAIKGQATELLDAVVGAIDDQQLATDAGAHNAESREQRDRLRALLKSRGAGPSTTKDAALRAGGLNLAAFFSSQPDTTTKLAGFLFAFVHLEIGAYELLRRVASRAGDEEVAGTVEAFLEEEHRAAERIAESWDRPDTPLGVST